MQLSGLLDSFSQLFVWKRVLEKLTVPQLVKFPELFFAKSHCLFFLHEPPLVPVLSQVNPFHGLPSYFSRIPFSIILQYIPGSGSLVYPPNPCIPYVCFRSYVVRLGQWSVRRGQTQRKWCILQSSACVSECGTLLFCCCCCCCRRRRRCQGRMM